MTLPRFLFFGWWWKGPILYIYICVKDNWNDILEQSQLELVGRLALRRSGGIVNIWLRIFQIMLLDYSFFFFFFQNIMRRHLFTQLVW